MMRMRPIYYSLLCLLFLGCEKKQQADISNKVILVQDVSVSIEYDSQQLKTVINRIVDEKLTSPDDVISIIRFGSGPSDYSSIRNIKLDPIDELQSAVGKKGKEQFLKRKELFYQNQRQSISKGLIEQLSSAPVDDKTYLLECLPVIAKAAHGFDGNVSLYLFSDCVQDSPMSSIYTKPLQSIDEAVSKAQTDATKLKEIYALDTLSFSGVKMTIILPNTEIGIDQNFSFQYLQTVLNYFGCERVELLNTTI